VFVVECILASAESTFLTLGEGLSSFFCDSNRVKRMVSLEMFPEASRSFEMPMAPRYRAWLASTAALGEACGVVGVGSLGVTF
jgi:hypothetical protein